MKGSSRFSTVVHSTYESPSRLPLLLGPIANGHSALYQQTRDLSEEVAQEHLKVEVLEQELQSLRLQANNYPWGMSLLYQELKRAKRRGMPRTEPRLLLVGTGRACGAPTSRTPEMPPR
ncbi:hypothetical protein LIER_22574 [Lithospermum erythrorhizon]|uniref:Uncharacterized protein n=1 Tax=Lithospermum erythrorhizon TaxID=34254 RepID=A0AAV3QXU2_LITER